MFYLILTIIILITAWIGWEITHAPYVDEEDNNKIENYIKTFLKPVCNIVKIKSIERNQINLNYTNDLLHIEVEVDQWYNNDIKEIIIDQKKEYYFEENKMLISLL